MALKPFSPLNVKDEIVNRIQDAVKQFCDQFNNKPLVDGILAQGLAITSSGNTFTHSLGRKPIGWVITDKNALSDVYRMSWDDKTITLKSTTNITVDIWIF